MGEIWKIVLTGGPCAGKTTALSDIMERFSSHMAVYCIPEMATLTFRAGVVIQPELYDFDQLVIFTIELIQ
jgi:nucleoside-triphosphatase THEP1